jgi:hypothetical protein
MGAAIFARDSKVSSDATTPGGATTRPRRWPRPVRNSSIARWTGRWSELRQRLGPDIGVAGNGARCTRRARSTGRSHGSRRWRPCLSCASPPAATTTRVNVARYHLKGDEPYLNEHAASLRADLRPGRPAQFGCDAFERPVGPGPCARLPQLRRAMGCRARSAAVARRRSQAVAAGRFCGKIASNSRRINHERTRRTALPILMRADSDGVATLTLNRPAQFNSLSEEMLTELQAALDAIAADKVGARRGHRRRRQGLLRRPRPQADARQPQQGLHAEAVQAVRQG